MLRSFVKIFLPAALFAVGAINAQVSELCSIFPTELMNAKSQGGDTTAALTELQKYAIAMWYEDRGTEAECTAKLQNLLKSCPETSRITAVVYGLPNKDCDAGYSSDGRIKSDADYKRFIQQLSDAIGTRKALLVLEPDAVGLSASGKCGTQKNYPANLKVALTILAANTNADIYLDVGYWTLLTSTDAAEVAKVVKDIAASGKIKGISLNTSNYRSNKQISELCSNFQTAYGDTSMNCIVDTSRNYREPASREWCNAKFGGIGHPPTSQTGFSNLDYFIWIKPPGESDGECNGGDRSSDSMKGPPAGKFFKEQFIKLWDQGYFVAEKGFAKLGTESSDTYPVAGSGGNSTSTTTAGSTTTSPASNTTTGSSTTPGSSTTTTGSTTTSPASNTTTGSSTTPGSSSTPASTSAPGSTAPSSTPDTPASVPSSPGTTRSGSTPTSDYTPGTVTIPTSNNANGSSDPAPKKKSCRTRLR